MMVKEISNIQYGTADGKHDGKPLLLDMYQPEVIPPEGLPVLIYIHGGGWYKGDKANEKEVRWNRFMAEQGYCAISINYRLSDEAAFPAQIHDVKAAVRWIRANGH